LIDLWCTVVGVPLLCPVQDFYIVEANEQQVFIAGSHRGGTVTLYLSDATGQFFVKSLDHVVAFVHRDNFFLDLYEVPATNTATNTITATTATTFSFGLTIQVFQSCSGLGSADRSESDKFSEQIFFLMTCSSIDTDM